MIIKKYLSVKTSSIVLLAGNLLWSLHLYLSSNCNTTTTTGSHHFIKNISAAHIASLKAGRLYSNSSNYRLNKDPPTNGVKKSESSGLAFENVALNLGRWDNQRVYKLFDFALIGDTYEESSLSGLVCLATQTSVERLLSVAEVAKKWLGPISVAVFVSGSEEFTILKHYVTYLRLCFDFVRTNVTFHLAFPHDRKPKHETADSYKLLQMFDCRNPQKTLHSMLQMRSTETIRWRSRNLYPQNHLRNFARKGCQTKYVFLTDVDIVPSNNIVPLLNEFLATARCATGLCAYVIPTLEIDDRVRFPSSKTELLRLVKRGLARPFHEKVFIYNQYATNFSSWLANSHTDDQLIAISHQVTNYEFFYEPFYVALDNVPPHDERFVGYGFTRNSQVYEMYVSGYSFYVLTPVFTCHWGLQKKNARPSWREQQNTFNSKRFEIFKKEIFARYKKPLHSYDQKKHG
ncbi:beta-1,4-glucuronyltransferase 1 [Lucilia sericata]|uniref:beta-1,4-glucuronyltransferase 1 n=1 Tax=Lucilia sericata TaxID=13632 RepID=UPI0018A83B0E|nr:beta-1,4-glucuronyltransferase 1 [Lucilia sericata]